MEGDTDSYICLPKPGAGVNKLLLSESFDGYTRELYTRGTHLESAQAEVGCIMFQRRQPHVTIAMAACQQRKGWTPAG